VQTASLEVETGWVKNAALRINHFGLYADDVMLTELDPGLLPAVP